MATSYISMVKDDFRAKNSWSYSQNVELKTTSKGFTLAAILSEPAVIESSYAK